VPLTELQAKLAASRQKLEHSQNTVAVAPPKAPATLTRKGDRRVARAPSGAPVDIQKGPPHSNESEQAVLSTLLQYPEVCVPEAKRVITREHFFNPINAELFDIIVSLWDEGKSDALGLIAFTELLRDRKRLDALGGASYVTNLAVAGIPSNAFSWYAQTLREKFVLRELIALGSKLVRASYGAMDDEVGDIIDDFSRWLERVRFGAGGLNGSEPQTIAALQAFDAHHDINALAGRRWLVRGGTSLWAGGSGYGKSALEMQFAIYWACGRKCFGMGPTRPVKSLIVQAENDLGDMAEQFQGVVAGITATQDLNVDEFKQLIEQNVIIHRIVGKTGVAFLTLLDALIQETRCDIVWVDPLFAFAGCDLMNAKETGRFLREGLFPIAVRRNIALQVLHHVGKPVRDKDESVAPMSEIDYQYLGFGTSEIQNSFRAVNVIVPIANTSTFKLVLSKRGERAGAKDIEGNWTRTLFLEHSKEGICWLQTDEPDAEVGRPPKFKLQDLLDEMSVTNSLKTGTLAKRLHDERNMSRATFFRLFDEGKKEGRIVQGDEGGWLRDNTPTL
jgi:hypothetical protein